MSQQKKKKKKDQFVMPSYVTGPRPRRGTIFLNANNLPGKILQWKLITLREADLNDLCPKELLLTKSRTFRGREGIDLLVHACHSISPFSFLISNFPFLFLFLFFSQYLFSCCDFLLEVTITVILIPFLLCTARISYIISTVIGFYYFSL